MGVESARNSFRATVLSGVKPRLVVTGKRPLHEGEADALDGVKVPRAEARRGDHRDRDRHRLAGEKASVIYEGKSHDVEVINLSVGGAMIRCGFVPMLWSLVELRFGEGLGLEGAVRWIKGDCIGLEFAHETKIDCNPEQQAALLLSVIQRSFPDELIRLEPAEIDEGPIKHEEDELGKRDEKRHPLIWMGEIHYAYDSNPVRLRNVSAGGALVDISTDYPVGAEVLLDLGDAGQFFTTVQWICGDQAGLRFVKPFDLACLANARPDLAPHNWNVPTFLDLDANEDDSPWNSRWNRSSIAEIRNDLEGFLKR